ncbi:DUF5327 family protein [Staphylococcus caeli]|uniref:DUF5327 family protein n=1 Tax=Staphylococcus caeli TaxID=2201815 RepID=UPI003F54B8DF
MEKDKIIQLIEQELVQADEASTQADFEKHMYAIHTLTSLVTETTTKATYSDNSFNVSASFPSSTKQQSTKTTQGISNEEIRAMGGKVSGTNNSNVTSNSTLSSDKLVTDDNIGNGDSIFDF